MSKLLSYLKSLSKFLSSFRIFRWYLPHLRNLSKCLTLLDVEKMLTIFGRFEQLSIAFANSGKTVITFPNFEEFLSHFLILFNCLSYLLRLPANIYQSCYFEQTFVLFCRLKPNLLASTCRRYKHRSYIKAMPSGTDFPGRSYQDKQHWYCQLMTVLWMQSYS